MGKIITPKAWGRKAAEMSPERKSNLTEVFAPLWTMPIDLRSEALCVGKTTINRRALWGEPQQVVVAVFFPEPDKKGILLPILVAAVNASSSHCDEIFSVIQLCYLVVGFTDECGAKNWLHFWVPAVTIENQFIDGCSVRVGPGQYIKRLWVQLYSGNCDGYIGFLGLVREITSVGFVCGRNQRSCRANLLEHTIMEINGTTDGFLLNIHCAAAVDDLITCVSEDDY